MNKIKDLDELMICFDVTTRVAVFALAYSCNADEIEFVMKVIGDQLSEASGDKESLPIIENYKDAMLQLRKSIESNVD